MGRLPIGTIFSFTKARYLGLFCPIYPYDKLITHKDLHKVRYLIKHILKQPMCTIRLDSIKQSQIDEYNENIQIYNKYYEEVERVDVYGTEKYTSQFVFHNITDVSSMLLSPNTTSPIQTTAELQTALTKIRSQIVCDYENRKTYKAISQYEIDLYNLSIISQKKKNALPDTLPMIDTTIKYNVPLQYQHYK